MLKKYIECFYIYEGKSNSVFNYVAFPHFNTGLSFFKGASVHRQNWNLQISENTNVGVHIEILGKYTTPLLVEYKGQLREISMVFKPLGLNRFFKDNYHSLAPKFSQELTNDVWSQFGESLFSSDDDISKIETFLLTALGGATAGHRAIRVKVVNFQSGANPTLRQSLIRTILLCLVVTAITYDENGRGLHERFSGTKLLDLRKSTF